MRIYDGDHPLNKVSLIKQIKRGKISMDLSFDPGSNLGQDVIRRLLEFYKLCMQHATQEKYQKLQGDIRFHFTRLGTFDLSFLATLSLLKRRIPKIEISLSFNGATKFESAPKVFFQFGHFMATSMTSTTQPLFRLIYNNRNIQLSPNNIQYFLISSTEYLPLLRIDPTEYGVHFQKTFKSLWDKELGEKIPISQLEKIFSVQISPSKPFREGLYQTFRSYVISIAAKNLEENSEPRLDRLSCVLSFLHASRRMGCINLLLQDYSQEIQNTRIKENILGRYGLGIKGFTSEDNRQYEHEMKKRIDIIFNSPLYLVMLFCILVENNFRFSSAEDNQLSAVLKRVDSIMSFSIQLFDGLNELVKNVLEHATEKWGILSLRLFNARNLERIKLTDFNTYLEKKRPQVQEYVDFVLLDDSISGILDQTINKLKAMKEEFSHSSEQKIINDDIERIQTGSVTLRDFFAIRKTPLLHQEIRSAASLGLLIFSDFVTKNDGVTYVSTLDGDTITATLVSKEQQVNLDGTSGMPFGTYYNVILPVPSDKPFKTLPTYTPYETAAAMDAYEELTRIRLLDCGDAANEINCSCLDNNRCLKKIDAEKQIVSNVAQALDALESENCMTCATRPQMILAIRLLDDSMDTDPSAIFRLLAQIQRHVGCRSVIVYNIKERNLRRLTNILRIYETITGRAWSKDQFVLFYYLPDIEQPGQRRYYTWIFGGERFDDTIMLNSQILLTNQGQMLTETTQNIGVPNSDFMEQYHLNPLFSGGNHLLPFDVLLREGQHTLFEWNVLAAINTPFEEGNYGYRFLDQHIKLGSKIHVKEFVYAKSLFQNSYYALRFGFLLADHIDRNLDKWLEGETEQQPKSLCILSYGLYSELMVSAAVRILSLRRHDWEVSRALVSDVESGQIQGESNLVDRKIILVISIASTLSTVTKIKDILRKKEGVSAQPINPPLNLIVAGHLPIVDICDDQGNITHLTVSKFWKHINADARLITTVDPDESIQKYNLYTPIGWNLPTSCELCSPESEKRTQEAALFETDQSSVTPFAIFGYPTGKTLPSTPTAKLTFGGSGDNAIISEEMIYYSHLKRGDNHYLYYVDTIQFLAKNENRLIRWCEQTRKDLRKQLKKENQALDVQTFLVAPSHTTNTLFINHVNNHVFGGSATIFHYEFKKDFSENLAQFFLRRIRPGSRVYFIDDALCTGSTFFRIHNFLKSQKNPPGVDGIFVMLNRLDSEAQDIILKDVNGLLYSFANLETSVHPTKRCYLCQEESNYTAILQNSVLDSTKIRYKWTKEKLRTHNVLTYTKPEKNTQDEFWRYKNMGCAEDQGRYLRRLAMTHKLYRVFATDKDALKSIFADKDHNKIDDLLELLGFEKKNDEHRASLLKLLSQPYFSFYSGIKKATLRWVAMEFNLILQFINQGTGKKLYEILNHYRYLKLLIKRLASLKSNFLVRADALEDVRRCYEKYKTHWQEKILDEILKIERNTSEISEKTIQLTLFDSSWTAGKFRSFLSSMDNFNLYYANAVKAIVWDDESKSLLLEKTLNELPPGPRTGFEKSFHSLHRILRTENVYVLSNFLNWMVSLLKGESSFSFRHNRYNDDVTVLLRFMKKNKMSDHYKAGPLIEYLNVHSRVEDIFQNDEFIKCIVPLLLLKIVIQQSLSGDESADEARSKMQYILFLLCKIIDIKVKEKDDDGNGAFCLARCDIRKTSEGPVLEPAEVATLPPRERTTLQSLKKMFSYEVLNGYKSKNSRFPWSNVEFVRNGDRLETYTGDPRRCSEVIEANPSPKRSMSQSPRNHLLFVRLSQLDVDIDDPGTGVLVFYREQADFLDERKLRYILLLRNDISVFVKSNFDTDSFRSWLYEQRELTLIDTMHHGFERELSELWNITVEERPPDDETFVEQFKIFHKILSSKIPYSRLIRDLNIYGPESLQGLLKEHRISKKRFNLKEFLGEIEKKVQLLYASKAGGNIFDVEVSTSCPKSIDTVYFYEDMLHHALFEFIRNAKNYVDEQKMTKEGKRPKIVISAHRAENGFVYVSFEDNGIGANQQIIASLNEYGYYGTGRGLKMFGYLWQEIVGEALFYESEERKYFKVVIPLGVQNER